MMKNGPSQCGKNLDEMPAFFLLMFGLVTRTKSPDIYVGAGLLFQSANDLLLSSCSCKTSLALEMNCYNFLR